VLLAARGLRRVGSSQETIADANIKALLRGKARKIQIAALVAGLLLTVIAWMIGSYILC
jgi:hypothetical protein